MSGRNWRAVSSRERCPICRKDHWCRIFHDGAIECMRVESDVACTSGGWLHWPDGRPQDANWQDSIRPFPKPEPGRKKPQLSPAMRDQVFGAWTSHPDAELTREHRRHFRDRGFPDDVIDANGYASHPGGRRERRRIADDLVQQFGSETMEQVPGFYWRSESGGDPEPMLAGGKYDAEPGILIPSRNEDGLIAALRFRGDMPSPKKKYTWISSLGRPGGTGSGAPIHVARPPRGVSKYSERGPLTEGEIKADYIAYKTGLVTIALPGVNTQDELPRVVRALNLTRVDIAFDADAKSNPFVLKHRNRAAEALAALTRDVRLISWPTVSDRQGNPTPKGLDDALKAGVTCTSAPYPFEKKRGRVVTIPTAAMPASLPKPIRHINEARAMLRWGILDALEDTTGNEFVQARAGTGIGKTFAVTQAINDLDADGWLHKTVMSHGVPMAFPIRLLYLCPTTEACIEVEAQLRPGLAIRQEGRNDDAHHPWGCLEPERVRLAGSKRHNPHADVCVTCAEYRGWAKSHPECGYLRSKAAVDQARVVVAPASSYFNGSEEIKDFDIIIFDEGIFPFLIEDILITSDTAGAWRTRMNQINSEAENEEHYPVVSPIRNLVEVLDMVQSHRPKKGTHGWKPAMIALRETRPDLAQIIRAVRSMPTGKSSGRYACETPELWSGDDRPLVPLRAIRDLADAIADELDREPDADTRLWLTPDGLLLLRPRQHILDILHQRKVINLDATPHAALRFFFPDAMVIDIDAHAYQHITQITDLLGTGRALSGKGNTNLRRINAAINHVIAGSRAPVILSRKALSPRDDEPTTPALEVNHPNARFGWYDNHTRGLNKFQDTDTLVVVGRYGHPIDRIRAEVMAARFSPDASPRGDREELLIYANWRDAEGNGKGRWCIADNDPDVNEAIRQDERASILQAIGRGRGVNRSPENPLPIYYLSNLPISDLPIDTLTTLEYLGGGKKKQGTNPEFRLNSGLRAAQSAHECAEKRAKVADAVAAFKAEGTARPSVAAVARRAGVHRDSIYSDDACRAMVGLEPSEMRITQVVGAGTDNSISISVPAPTLVVIREDGTPGLRSKPKSRTFTPHHSAPSYTADAGAGA